MDGNFTTIGLKSRDDDSGDSGSVVKWARVVLWIHPR